MHSQTALFILSAAIGAAVVRSQAAPNWIYIPSACSDQCSQTIESAYLCQNQFTGSTTDIYSCFCDAFPSDASTCATCLNSNGAQALGALVSSTVTACPQAVQSCFFSCSFDTCASSDIACQCDASYLSSIFNCASCNTANGNTGSTQLSDFQSLQDSCKNQGYTGADQSFVTEAPPSPATDGYVAPTLTATGGGAAATGDATATDGVLAAGAGAAAPSAAAPVSGGAGAAVAASGAGAAAVSGAASGAVKAATVTVVQAAAASSGAASPNSFVPALGGMVAVLGAVVAVL